MQKFAALGAGVGLLLALSAIFGCTCGEPPPPATDASEGIDTGLPDDAGEPSAVRIFTIDPDNGPFTGGTVVTIIGTGFVGDETVVIGGNMVDPLLVVVQDANIISAITPAGPPGPADVVVSGSAGQDVLEGGFTYDAFYVDPDSGPTGGGTFVTITGTLTAFAPGVSVLFDNQPCANVTVLSPEVMTCNAPPGYAGDADVEVVGEGVADDAYEYLDQANPSGGLGGGPIMGTVAVTVFDAMTAAPIEDAFVMIGSDPTTPFQGLTSSSGQIVFSDPTLVGPISVTAAKMGYESTSIVVFDALDVTIFLVPIPDPMPGPPGPGLLAGLIRGNIAFGGPTGLGDSSWALVPEPRYVTERKVAMVYTTEADLYVDRVPPGGGATVYWDETGETSTYPYQVNSRLGTLGVYALGGLLDSATNTFQAFAFGITRGLIVGPGDILEGVDIIIDTSLDQVVTVNLNAPPPFGFPGPDEYRAEAYIELGGEGMIRRTDVLVRDPSGATTLVVPAQSGLFGTVSDGTYTIVGSAYTGDANPYSVVLLKGVADITSPIDVGPFIGIPEPVDPPYGGTITGWHLEFAEDGAPADFHVMLIYKLDLTPVWRVFLNGPERSFDLPDLYAMGVLPAEAAGQFLVWAIFSIQIPAYDFDNFSYRDLQQRYWNAYAVDGFIVQI